MMLLDFRLEMKQRRYGVSVLNVDDQRDLALKLMNSE